MSLGLSTSPQPPVLLPCGSVGQLTPRLLNTAARLWPWGVSSAGRSMPRGPNKWAAANSLAHLPVLRVMIADSRWAAALLY